jgi:hypothetical protein
MKAIVDAAEGFVYLVRAFVNHTSFLYLFIFVPLIFNSLLV